MDIWELPTSLCVDGESWNIRSDFRAALDILKYFSDPDYELDEQWEICLDILYENYADMPARLKQEAAEKAMEFINMGAEEDKKPKPRLMDWEQDASVIIPSVNRVLGREVRAMPYLHWWTFLSAYMEIGEGLFSQILGIRQKKAKGKKLEKWEQEFCRENMELIDLKKKYSEEEKEEQNRLLAIFD